ncbi:MAG TPA: branched-chain amino acid ABC transporter permease [bacterium]|nr:branched-chain amino acid ABC transporter permease [bacterium]
MEGFLQLLLNGTALGSIYALIALGYTMVYGILRLINFAHGDIVMVGAYAGLFTALGLHASDHPTPLNFFLVLTAAMLASGLLGYFIERLAYRPLRNAPRLNLLITAVGVSLLLENLGQVLFGATPRVFPEIMPNITLLQVGQVAVTNQQVTVFFTSLFLMIVLEFIVLKTKVGRAMRAVSHSHETASLVGIPTDKIISLTFIIGSALAAAAGILVGISYPKVDPLMGVMIGIKAFVAAVLGGIGSIRGAVVGGFLMGISEAMVVGYGSSTYRDALAFAILILILLFKPAGLFGKYQPEKV